MSEDDTSLAGSLIEAARRHRDAIAVVDRGSGYTYRELDESSARVAGGLVRNGIGPGAVVAVHAVRSWARCVAVLALWRAGAGVLSVDPALPPARKMRIAEGAGAAMVLSAGDGPRADLGIAEYALGELTAAPPAERPDGPVGYVIATSGSTGEPKLVALPPRVLTDLGAWHIRHRRYDSPPHTLHMTSVGFDVGYEEMVATWLAGATLVVVGDEERQDPFLLIDTVREHAAARMFLPVAGLHGLATAAVVGEERMPSLRELVVAGERLVLNDEIRRFCAAGDIALVNQYGPSETHVVTEHRLPGAPASWPDRPPIGTPVAGAGLLRHADGVLRPFALDETGELVVSGNCLAREYIGDGTLTAAKFRTLPDRENRPLRCYFTGDLVRFDGREFHFLSRTDDQMKVSGHRVEPGEVEAVLGTVPGIRRAAVVGVRVSVSTQLAAFYTCEAGAAVGTEELAAECAAHLPAYMLPRHFRRCEDLPLTPNGKIDRRRLQASF
ncbi:AMP-binding protein [Streptomyces violaceusniger]|uniref:AMP-binding protein n=1 Tax=Streptomyces violaceusniger TaxID=68280 RepID=UPI00342B413D